MRMAPYYINLRDTPGHNLCMAPNLTRYSVAFTVHTAAHTPRRHAPRSTWAEQIECNARPSDSDVGVCAACRAWWGHAGAPPRDMA